MTDENRKEFPDPANARQHEPEHQPEPKPKSDPKVVRGAEAIGREIDENNKRRVYYWLGKGLVPGATKIGNTWQLSVLQYRRVMHGDAA